MTKESRKEAQSSPPDPPKEIQTPEQAGPDAGLLPFEQVAAAQGVTGWQLAALVASESWLPGREVTTEEFSAALKAVHEEVIL